MNIVLEALSQTGTLKGMRETLIDVMDLIGKNWHFCIGWTFSESDAKHKRRLFVDWRPDFFFCLAWFCSWMFGQEVTVTLN